VSNSQLVIKMAKENRERVHVHTFGLGDDVDRGLVQ